MTQVDDEPMFSPTLEKTEEQLELSQAGAPDVPAARAERLSLLRCSFPDVRSILLAFMVCVVAPLFLVGLHIHENPRFSPIDEGAHYDYVNRIADGTIPHVGERMLPSTLQANACIGNAMSAVTTPPCNSPHITANQFAGGGYSYEAQQPPGYYAITVPFRWFFVHVVGLSDLSGTRAVGGLWLAAGLLMLWMAGRLLGLRPSLVGVAALLVAVGPLVIYESSIVSNSASSVFGGSAVALVSVLAWRRPGRWVMPGLIGVGILVTALMESNAFAIVVAALMFVVLAIARESKSTQHGARWRSVALVWSWFKSWATTGGALLLGCVVTVVAWQLEIHATETISLRVLPVYDVLRGHPVGVSLIAREALALLTPATGGYFAMRTTATGAVTSATAANLQTISTMLLGYLYVAAGAAWLFVRRNGWAAWLSAFCLPVLFVGGIVQGIGMWLSDNADPGLASRYGLCLVPLLALALVGLVRGRWVARSLWLYAICMFGLTTYYMVAR